MCKTYNTIGSLTTLKTKLKQHGIDDFKSIHEVIEFQKSYFNLRNQIISNHENHIELEKKTLSSELPILKDKIQKEISELTNQLKNEINHFKQLLIITKSASHNFFNFKFLNYFRVWNFKRKIKFLENNLENTLELATQGIKERYQITKNRHDFLISNFNIAVQESAQIELANLDRKKNVIDELNSYIYGAIGEQKVVRTLEILSDDFYLINDFSVTFSQAIFNRQKNDYIKSIQIDHILVTRCGVFLIETKNWNEKSVTNLSLRSPVEQVKRSSFAVFHLLNNEKSKYHLNLNSHHWGNKKIPIKNLIVLTNAKPKEDFQYVKVLNLSELVSYIHYFEPVFSSAETSKIAEMILKISQNN